MEKNDNLRWFLDQFSWHGHILRVFTLILVVVFHLSTFVPDFRKIENSFLRTFLDLCEAGTDIFIFLSSVFNAFQWITRKKERSPGTFLRNRVLRVYPEFWLVLLFTFFVVSLRGRVLNAEFVFLGFTGWQSIIFNKANYFPIDPPLWFITLILECYLLFPFLVHIAERRFRLDL